MMWPMMKRPIVGCLCLCDQTPFALALLVTLNNQSIFALPSKQYISPKREDAMMRDRWTFFECASQLCVITCYNTALCYNVCCLSSGHQREEDGL
uniref:Putative secreted protein n=1 Tax=Anopheles darlingi TaxID=43151 RepID=A0A2M4DJI6_ANODA